MLLLGAVVGSSVAQDMPSPWTRVLALTQPPMQGDDVFIAQNLLARLPANLTASGTFDNATAAAVFAFKSGAECCAAAQHVPLQIAHEAVWTFACESVTWLTDFPEHNPRVTGVASRPLPRSVNCSLQHPAREYRF